MIAFTAPWALGGLVAAALPLLLHLIQRHEAPEVTFPAVRYLEDATRDQQKRLKFRNLLLLIVRTLLIVALVLAAAGATVRRSPLAPHAPSALVLVVDNSAASGMVIDGEPLIAAIQRAGARVLDRATLGDRLWLIGADGVARSGTAADLRKWLAAMRPEPLRLDLGRSIATGRELLRGASRAGEVVVIGALQRTAVTAAAGSGALLVIRPDAPPPANRGVRILSAGLQPWGPDGGRATISIASTDTVPLPVTLSVNGRALRDVLVTPGLASVQRIGPQPAGWTTITAALPPDEFRLDDAATIPLRVAPPVAVEWDATDRYIAAAAQVLAADGRIRAGGGIHLGSLGPGVSIVMPPGDAALAGALNRTLAGRGINWRFGNVVALTAGQGTGSAERTDSSAMIPSREPVTRRYTLEHTGTDGDVLATVGGAPWIVRTGNVVLVGSRLDPAWTALPLSASFVPFLDAMLTSAARGEVLTTAVTVGDQFQVPERTTAVAHDGTAMPVEGGSLWVPRSVGVFHLLAGADTLGAVSVRLDPRTTDLARAADADVRALWSGAVVAGMKEGPSLAFSAASRADLRGALLLLALLCLLVEAGIVGRTGA